MAGAQLGVVAELNGSPLPRSVLDGVGGLGEGRDHKCGCRRECNTDENLSHDDLHSRFTIVVLIAADQRRGCW
jgi:hypothetical protein